MNEQPTLKGFEWASPAFRERCEKDPVSVLRDRGVHTPAEVPVPILHDFIRMTHLLWVDGKIVPVDQFTIDPSDEGLLFGRGVWESTRTIESIPWLWSLHVERFLISAQMLAISLTPDRVPNAQAVSAYVRSLGSQDVILRMNASAGRPGKPGLVWMSAAIQPITPSSLRLKTVTSPVQKGQAYLTLKTFQYATRLRIGQQVGDSGFDSALLLDGAGNILESSHANIFVRLREGWVTPTSDGGFLPGTVRRYLIEKSPLPIKEQVVPLSVLGNAKEVFVTNSNLGIVPITQIDDYAFPIGEETRHLTRWLEPKQQPGGAVQYRFRDRGEVAR
jgi:branched-subunit amino acid aminotransferase/4-amino-4-deoxychorismate lyase